MERVRAYLTLPAEINWGGPGFGALLAVVADTDAPPLQSVAISTNADQWRVVQILQPHVEAFAARAQPSLTRISPLSHT